MKKKPMLKMSKSLAAAAVLSASVSVQAADSLVLNGLAADLTAGTYEFDNSVPGGTFSDTWQFTLAGDSAENTIFLDPKNVKLGQFTVFDTAINQFLFNGSGVEVEEIVDLGPLMAGVTYTITVSGEYLGGLAAGYDGALKVAPVPLPAAAWLMLTALIGLGVFSRRRNQMKAYAA